MRAGTPEVLGCQLVWFFCFTPYIRPSSARRRARRKSSARLSYISQASAASVFFSPRESAPFPPWKLHGRLLPRWTAHSVLKTTSCLYYAIISNRIENRIKLQKSIPKHSRHIVFLPSNGIIE